MITRSSDAAAVLQLIRDMLEETSAEIDGADAVEAAMALSETLGQVQAWLEALPDGQPAAIIAASKAGAPQLSA